MRPPALSELRKRGYFTAKLIITAKIPAERQCNRSMTWATMYANAYIASRGDKPASNFPIEAVCKFRELAERALGREVKPSLAEKGVTRH